MSTVKFATYCDKCQEKSEEYTVWPSCKECGEHACFDCDIEKQRDGETCSTICRKCADRIVKLAAKLNGSRDRPGAIGLVRNPKGRPKKKKCAFGDPLCPCQDGDSCHYVDTATTKAWPAPTRNTFLLARKKEAK